MEVIPANVEEELSGNFQIARVGAQQPPLYNLRVNYGSNGSSVKKGKLRLKRKVIIRIRITITIIIIIFNEGAQLATAVFSGALIVI